MQTASCEFLPPEHPHEVVTAETLEAHRAARREAEQQRSGVPRAVRYEGIAAEQLNTADVVELLVRPVARETHLSYAAARVPRAHTGAPTHFASHAWGRPFGLLVEGLKAYFAGAVPEEVRPPFWTGIVCAQLVFQNINNPNSHPHPSLTPHPSSPRTSASRGRSPPPPRRCSCG